MKRVVFPARYIPNRIGMVLAGLILICIVLLAVLIHRNQILELQYKHVLAASDEIRNQQRAVRYPERYIIRRRPGERFDWISYLDARVKKAGLGAAIREMTPVSNEKVGGYVVYNVKLSVSEVPAATCTALLRVLTTPLPGACITGISLVRSTPESALLDADIELALIVE